MKKRLLSLLLSALLFAACVPVAAQAAEADVPVDEAAQVLAALEIMVGNESGDLMLGRTITRAEFTKMVIASSVYKDSVGEKTTVSPYPDVPYTHWAAPYVEAAVRTGYVNGYLDGTFRPQNTITLAEAATMALRLLGYQGTDFSGAYPSGQMSMYRTLELDRGVRTLSAGTAITRQDALYLFYNLLTAKNKSGMAYLLTLGHSLTASGEIDRVALVNSAMKGPITADAEWRSHIPFDVSNAKFYRSGKTASPSDVRPEDQLYWSKPMRSVWIYDSRVTGVYQSAAPSASAPQSVVVAGKSYMIETAAAAYALSDMGSFRAGDIVTLLLGRNGGVAAVKKPGQTDAFSCGVVTQIGAGAYSDGDGGSYTVRTATVAATDGGLYIYPVQDKTLVAGDLVQISAETGTVKRLPTASLFGKVDAGGKKLGKYSFAEDAEILDLWGETGALRIYPERLADVSVSERSVRYYRLNEKGEISHLILKEVTGDYYSYGVLTDVSELSADMKNVGQYTYDIGGVPGFHISTDTVFDVKKGPCRLIFYPENGAVKNIANLQSVSLESVSEGAASDGKKSYRLSDTAAVYEVREGVYYLSSLNRVKNGNFSLTGYYDRSESEGGRIRVLIAR